MTATRPAGESPPRSGSAPTSSAPPTSIRERLRLYRDAGVTTLRAQLQGDPTTDLDRQIDDLGQLLDLVADVNREHVTPMSSTTTEHLVTRWSVAS